MRVVQGGRDPVARRPSYVISGDLHRHIHAGEHHRAAPGTTHEGIRTDGGCLLLTVDAAA